MNRPGSLVDPLRREPIKRPFSEAWYYPIVCAIGFAIVLAASITSPESPRKWHALLGRLGSPAVIVPTLIGLMAGYVMRYFLLRRENRSSTRHS